MSHITLVMWLIAQCGLSVALHGQQQQMVGGGEGDQNGISDSVRQQHTVHVSPHLIVFDPHTRTASLEFSNQGATPIQADVEIQYGITDWPDNDLPDPFNPHYPNPRDTVIEHPTPKDRYAGRWISGLPTHVALQAHQTQRVTMRIDPPANLPAGEYFARVVTIVRPPMQKRGVSKDTKAVYQLPVKRSDGLPSLRDSVRVFYRQGTLKLGIAIDHPTTGIGQQPAGADLELKDDWVHVPFRLTGNMHFEGQIKHFFRNTDTGEQVVALTTRLISLQRDGVIHHWCDVPASQPLPQGHYQLVIILDATQEEFPTALRVPMKPVEVSLPFEIK